MAGLLGGFRRAAPSSVHKMAVKPCCYGNTSVKLPPYPQTISIIPHPPDITPFPSGPADRRMSVCCVGQQASKAGLCSAPK